MSTTFLDQAELAQLTGRKIKSKQIEALRQIGLAFFVNATGHPVVARAAIESRAVPPPKEKKQWAPRVLKGN
jgi:hypothetical protein